MLKPEGTKLVSSELKTSPIPTSFSFSLPFYKCQHQGCTGVRKWQNVIISRKKRKIKFIKLVTHWKRVTKSPGPDLGDSWVIPLERKRGCPGRAEGPATLEGEAAASPRRGRVRVPSQGPQSRSRNAGRGSDMARRARRRPQVLGPRRDRDEAAPPALPRPRGGPTGLPRLPALLACPLLQLPAAPPATPGPPLAVPPCSGRGLAASARGAAHSPLSAPPPPRPPHFTPLPSGELPAPAPSAPAPRHVTPNRGPHVTPPFLSSLPPAPAPSGPLAPPYWPARPWEETPFGGGARCNTLRRGAWPPR